LGPEAGLVEVVSGSKTLSELSRNCPRGERHLRILRELGNDPRRIATLGASTAAYLTLCYALGIGDGHDDNLMLAGDGSLFRIDFGFVFGQTPTVDCPTTFVPRAVVEALGRDGWQEVMALAERALQVASVEGKPPGWNICRGVPELHPFKKEAKAHAQTLSGEDFRGQLQQADEWDFWRFAKNTVREMTR